MAEDFRLMGAVAIGRNEGRRLLRCLSSLQQEFQTIVYVDSGSTDGSVEAARKLGVKVVPLDMSVPFTAARARNEGVAALKESIPEVQIVQFIDGDCELIEGWVAAGLDLLKRKPDVAAVCGRRRERFPVLSIYHQVIDGEWNTPPGEAEGCGGDSLVRIGAFDRVGGFRNGLIAGEEPEMCVRLREAGWKIWRLDVDMTWHDIAMTRFAQWWSRGNRSGYGCAQVAWLHRNSPYGIWKRQTLSAIFWAGLVPLAIMVGAAIYPPLVLGILIYPFQVARIALRRGLGDLSTWKVGVLMMLNHFAVFQGILILLWRTWRGEMGRLIEYK